MEFKTTGLTVLAINFNRYREYVRHPHYALDSIKKENRWR
jgi:hypothetical protein